MSRAFVSAAARWSRFLAGWGALVVLGHFALDATAWAAERREAEENERALGKRDERALAMERAKNALEGTTAGLDRAANDGTHNDRPQADRTASSSAEQTSRVRPKPRGTGAPKRRTLFVDLGPSRSDVFVNGVGVGRTPYAGTWSCRDGDEVGIVVLPPGLSPPIHTSASCGGSIRADRRENAKELDEQELARLLEDEEVGVALKDALRRRGASR